MRSVVEKLFRGNLKEINFDTDCSPENGPHGLHVLPCGPCGPARVHDAAEEYDEHADPDGPREEIARPGE